MSTYIAPTSTQHVHTHIYIYMHVHRGGCACTLALLRMLACMSFDPFGAKSSDSSVRDKVPQKEAP